MKHLAVLALFILVAAGTAAAQGEPAEDLLPPLLSASVHDPSIIKVGDVYYVFGSHLAAAKSTDLRNWQAIEHGYTTRTG